LHQGLPQPAKHRAIDGVAPFFTLDRQPQYVAALLDNEFLVRAHAMPIPC
jgi:hypothetical protein